MVYTLHFGVEQVQDQLTLSILIYFHGEPNLGMCHTEYSFKIVSNSFQSKQGKCRAYQVEKKGGYGKRTDTSLIAGRNEPVSAMLKQ